MTWFITYSGYTIFTMAKKAGYYLYPSFIVLYASIGNVSLWNEKLRLAFLLPIFVYSPILLDTCVNKWGYAYRRETSGEEVKFASILNSIMENKIHFHTLEIAMFMFPIIQN